MKIRGDYFLGFEKWGKSEDKIKCPIDGRIKINVEGQIHPLA